MLGDLLRFGGARKLERGGDSDVGDRDVIEHEGELRVRAGGDRVLVLQRRSTALTSRRVDAEGFLRCMYLVVVTLAIHFFAV